MPRHVWACLLCMGLLLHIPSRAEDARDDLAALLSRADVTARGFRGEFEIFGGYDQPEKPLDFRTDDLRWKFKGRLWVRGADALVEFLRHPAATPSESNDPYKNLIQALAASEAGTFDFQSFAPGHATLKTYTPAQPERVRNRIDAEILDPLNAFSTINGFPIESLLTSGEAVVRADPATGRYSITAHRGGAKNPSNLTYELTVMDQTVNCSSKLTVGPPESAITIETLAEGDILSGALVPRRVAKRISAPAWGNLGPGQRDVTREVALFTPENLAAVPFPITPDFFKKYGWTYTVTQGAASTPNRFATPTVLALGAFAAALIAASGYLLRLWFRRGRSTSKKTNGPFGELL